MREPDYIPEPTVFLTGCQPWPPRARPGERCPVCKGGIRDHDHHVYCGWSDDASPAREARIRSARLGLAARDKAAADEQRINGKLQAARAPVLTEIERRCVWNGYRKTILVELIGSEVNNLAKTGRDWLVKAGQEPNWDLILDRRGNVVGRREASGAP